MRIRTKFRQGLAINPRKTVFFEKGEFLETGDKDLTEENLKRLVEIDFAVDVSTIEPEAEEGEVEKSESENSDDEIEPAYKSFTTKVDLEEYAREKYSIELDKRKSLAGMVEQFETAMLEAR